MGDMRHAEAHQQKGRQCCSQSEGESDTACSDGEGCATVMPRCIKIQLRPHKKEKEDEADIADHLQWMQPERRKQKRRRRRKHMAEDKRAEQETAGNLAHHPRLSHTCKHPPA